MTTFDPFLPFEQPPAVLVSHYLEFSDSLRFYASC